MNTTADVISVLIDGITDIDKMIRFASDAVNAGKEIEHEWFNRHIVERYRIAVEDYEWILRNTSIRKDIDADDAIAISMDKFIRLKLDEFERRIEKIK